MPPAAFTALKLRLEKIHDLAQAQQLLEWDRLRGEAGGDRWFVASLEGSPASSCCLFQRDGIGQARPQW